MSTPVASATVPLPPLPPSFRHRAGADGRQAGPRGGRRSHRGGFQERGRGPVPNGNQDDADRPTADRGPRLDRAPITAAYGQGSCQSGVQRGRPILHDGELLWREPLTPRRRGRPPPPRGSRGAPPSCGPAPPPPGRRRSRAGRRVRRHPPPYAVRRTPEQVQVGRVGKRAPPAALALDDPPPEGDPADQRVPGSPDEPEPAQVRERQLRGRRCVDAALTALVGRLVGLEPQQAGEPPQSGAGGGRWPPRARRGANGPRRPCCAGPGRLSSRRPPRSASRRGGRRSRGRRSRPGGGRGRRGGRGPGLQRGLLGDGILERLDDVGLHRSSDLHRALLPADPRRRPGHRAWGAAYQKGRPRRPGPPSDRRRVRRGVRAGPRTSSRHVGGTGRRDP